MFSVCVREHECGLYFRDGEYLRWLPPGVHRLRRPWADRIEKICRLEPELLHAQLDALLGDASLRRQLDVRELEPSERALVWRRGRLACVVGPGRHAFWAEPDGVVVEVHDVGELRLQHPRLDEVIRFADRCCLFSVVNAARHEELQVLRDGREIERLGPGAHVFWQGADAVRWRCVEKAAPGRGNYGKQVIEAQVDEIQAFRA